MINTDHSTFKPGAEWLFIFKDTIIQHTNNESHYDSNKIIILLDNNDCRGVELELAAADVAEDMLDDAAREGVASVAQAAVRDAKNEELQKRLHHESKMSAAEDVCESIAGRWPNRTGTDASFNQIYSTRAN